jgi:protein-S-isoprenylcysteine O-methyltransferase Ste14
MLWIRGLLFTVLVPGMVGGVVPILLSGGRPLQDGVWRLGWIPVSVGAAIYLSCLVSFLAAGGTPTPFFARGVRGLIGEEPAKLVCGGLYQISRNPMYVGVLLVVFGQAVLFASGPIALYGLAAWLFLHVAVVAIEEPHLRAGQGQSYEEYCRRTPRWLGLPRSH